MTGLPERLRARHRVRAAVRAHFERHGFLEVEPPTVVPAPGMEPHITAVELTVDDGRGPQRRWLHTSPEFAMKKLLAGGAERIYALTRVFRAGEHGPHHRLEFTMLEWYRAHAGYPALMEDCEGLLSGAALALHGTTRVGELDVAPPYERLTLAEAFHRYAGVDLLAFVDPLDGRGLQQAARQAGLAVVEGPAEEHPVEAFERAFYEVMLARVEPAMGRARPTFLYDWPAPLCALARLSPADPRVAERVELYAAGVELGNGFGELTDADEQAARFRAEQERRAATGRPVYPVDEEFLEALRRMPPAAGMAVGLDRLLMVAAGRQDLADVLA
ncbi:MAG: EF-P lysine aminoacylase GenX [Deltaproteobacteria bacterium]|nr:EF-P lysine aminoacylase GenX [Deltaproteobacteria bacterium]